MRYVARRPRAPLGDHVEHLWCLSDAPAHARERIVPSGTIELVVNLHEDAFRIYEPATGHQRRYRGIMVSGCYSTAFEIETRAHARILGAHFKPGGAARLLGVPAGLLADTHVALDDLWGQSAIELRARLCNEPSIPRALELLEQALNGRLPGTARPRTAVEAALAQLEGPGIEVGDVSAMLGLSRRRFIEVFTRDVGMAPKRYAKVRRFQRALALAGRTPTAAWARLALDTGYFDQAHLCRDWAELTGLSPNKLLGLRAIEVKENHVALPTPGVKSVQSSLPTRK